MVKLVHMIIVLIFISSIMFALDARMLSQRRVKIAKFRVYVHDVMSGPNATVHEVARANITSNSLTSFGQVAVADDLMTIRSSAESQELGRVQALVTNTGLEDQNFNINALFIFKAGKYSGSTLSILGFKSIPNSNQNIPIVGGTGIFSMARGHTICNLYSYDPVANIYIWIYDMNVVYRAE